MGFVKICKNASNFYYTDQAKTYKIVAFGKAKRNRLGYIFAFRNCKNKNNHFFSTLEPPFWRI